MLSYTPPVEDFEFIFGDWLNIYQYKMLPSYKNIDPALISTTLSEMGRFCHDVYLPINQRGDRQGCSFENGKVTTPEGFKEAYQLFVDAGWGGIDCLEEHGGQGLPELMYLVFAEMQCSTNPSMGIFTTLTRGAYHLLHKYGAQELQDLYLPYLASGKWTGTMVMSEPQSGTDVGLIRTIATPQEDGTYSVSGTKIFISGGDHDIAENIVHMVLARTPDAPKGAKGLSLFLVPKIKVKTNGTLGEANNVYCRGVEHKMGIHASPTCVMEYDGSEGYLVGELHHGLKQMYQEMNEERLYVGINALGLAEAAYQNAAQYAKDRKQGKALRPPMGAKLSEGADSIIVHPDVRRMLFTMRSFIEGARALGSLLVLKIDISNNHPKAKERQKARDFMELATPIVKAYLTDMGYDATNMGLQVFGGAGYIRETGIEQLVRDTRITQIYEGSNGYQALELVGRKLSMYNGRYLRAFFAEATEFVERHCENKAMAPYNKALHKAIVSAQRSSIWVAINGMQNPDNAGAVSVDYLRIMALAMMAYVWVQMAEVALKKLASKSKKKPINREFYESKLMVADFFMQKVLPEHHSLLVKVFNGSVPVMQMQERQF